MLLPTAMSTAPCALMTGIAVHMTHKYVAANVAGWALTMVGFALLSLLEADSPVGKWVGYQLLAAMGTGIIVSAFACREMRELVLMSTMLVPVLVDDIPGAGAPLGVADGVCPGLSQLLAFVRTGTSARFHLTLALSDARPQTWGACASLTPPFTLNRRRDRDWRCHPAEPADEAAACGVPERVV